MTLPIEQLQEQGREDTHDHAHRARRPQAVSRNIKDRTLAELAEWFATQGEPPFRARQVFQWLYQRGATDFEQMTNLAKPLRRLLAEHFELGALGRARVLRSADGSLKYAFALADGREVESVLMPNATHHTLCVSTQVGCAMGCDFCMTGRMGLVRNLTPGEIVGQVVEAARDVDEGKFIRNVVFMGMGEPLHNYRALVKAIDILREDMGFGFSARRVTVSTSGLVPQLRWFAQDRVRAQLAISLNATTDAVRSRLMPVNRRWNIAALLEACREFPVEHRSRITFEYILIQGVTDDLADARRLVKLLHGLKCKVNLIPFNATPDSAYQAPPIEHVQAFQQALLERGLLATVRLSKGQDIQAACGQLVVGERRRPLPGRHPAT